MGLSRYEQETIINFNKAEDIAYVFTYEKTWQQHIERRLKIEPFLDNGKGGKEYKIPKSRISKPRAPRTLSLEARQRLSDRLKKARGSKK